MLTTFLQSNIVSVLCHSRFLYVVILYMYKSGTNNFAIFHGFFLLLLILAQKIKQLKSTYKFIIYYEIN